jgi:hypothetical protein
MEVDCTCYDYYYYYYYLISVALQPSAGYGLLWLCSPAQAMASCGDEAQRRLGPPVAWRPRAGADAPVRALVRLQMARS